MKKKKQLTRMSSSQILGILTTSERAAGHDKVPLQGPLDARLPQTN